DRVPQDVDQEPFGCLGLDPSPFGVIKVAFLEDNPYPCHQSSRSMTSAIWLKSYFTPEAPSFSSARVSEPVALHSLGVERMEVLGLSLLRPMAFTRFSGRTPPPSWLKLESGSPKWKISPCHSPSPFLA